MLSNIENLFAELLTATEIRKIDFKRDQYPLENDYLKSKFIKDILCIVNAPGNDGYILLGVKSERGKPREVIGISKHYDSSDLEQIVNSKIEGPIHFDYYSLKYEGLDCALIYIPKSKGRPHWPKDDFQILKKHIFYTRRASGNREATIQEIRDMFIETLRVSEVALRKMKSSPHIVDELVDMNLDERKIAMFNMLKKVTREIGLNKYYLLTHSSLGSSIIICALVDVPNSNIIPTYAVFMYPWTAKGINIIYSRGRVTENPYMKSYANYGMRKSPATRNRLRESSLIHISYKSIYTKVLESRPYSPTGHWFANKWTEAWGTIMKWEYRSRYRSEKAKYEFFLQNISSKDELKDRLDKLINWVKDRIE